MDGEETYKSDSFLILDIMREDLWGYHTWIKEMSMIRKIRENMWNGLTNIEDKVMTTHTHTIEKDKYHLKPE